MKLKPTVLRFKVDNFESLPSEPGAYKNTEIVKDCHNNKWRIEVYPGGWGQDDSVEKTLTLLLLNMSGHSINATYAMILRNREGGVYYEGGSEAAVCFKAKGNGSNVSSTLRTNMTRSAILDGANNVLVDGTLIIDVELQIISKPNEFRPSNPLVENMLKLFEDKDDADVTFKVGSVIISAHKFVLKVNAPVLLRFCDESDGGSHVSIMDATPEVFNIVMRYAYGEDTPEENIIKKLGKELIEAANRYGVVRLKMAVETSLVEQRVIHKCNVVDWLLFADAKTCPLLKEYAMAYFSGRVADMLAYKTFKKLEEAAKRANGCHLKRLNQPNQ